MKTCEIMFRKTFCPNKRLCFLAGKPDSTRLTARCVLFVTLCHYSHYSYYSRLFDIRVLHTPHSIYLFVWYYRKIHCRTSEFHVKFHLKNRYCTHRFVIRAYWIFKWNLAWNSQVRQWIFILNRTAKGKINYRAQLIVLYFVKNENPSTDKIFLEWKPRGESCASFTIRPRKKKQNRPDFYEKRGQAVFSVIYSFLLHAFFTHYYQG